ncbi:MAG: bacteriophage protein, partial [Mycobacterium sp.]|nr:bacteriophage protein [Mycobacterium sp.]
DYAMTAEPELFMQRQGAHPTGEMDLLGRRLAVVSESERDKRLNEVKMKQLTGGDTIRARKMHKDFIEFHPSHTPVLITNHLPKVSGDDQATWRRLRVIPFDVVIPPEERNVNLDDELQAEADAVMAWAVAGWVQYTKRGLDEPPAVLKATDNYRLDSDAVRRFVSDEDWVVVAPAVKATTATLHEAWEKWRATDGADPMSQKAFGRALDLQGYPADPPSCGKRWRWGIAVKVVEDDS